MELNMINVIVPGGCTRAVQTCDVMWNAPLKAYLKESWNEWMREGLKSYTKSSKMRSMSKMQICDSIVSAWNKISPDMIKKSFEMFIWMQNSIEFNLPHYEIPQLSSH